MYGEPIKTHQRPFVRDARCDFSKSKSPISWNLAQIFSICVKIFTVNFSETKIKVQCGQNSDLQYWKSCTCNSSEKAKVWILAVPLVKWVRFWPAALYNFGKWQLIGMSWWYRSAFCGHPLRPSFFDAVCRAGSVLATLSAYNVCTQWLHWLTAAVTALGNTKSQAIDIGL